MILFISHLKKEVDAKIGRIECSEISMITKSLEGSHFLTDAVNRLKIFVLSYNFKGNETSLSVCEIRQISTLDTVSFAFFTPNKKHMNEQR